MSDTTINDGGPAFPIHHYTDDLGPTSVGFPAKDVSGNRVWVNSGAPGMSLRDWLAGQATAEEVNHYQEWTSHADGGVPTYAPTQARYIFADAMLAERERGQNDGD